MAFNINAHVILSGPKNIKAVTKNIQQQLGTVNAKINLQAPKNLSKQLGAFNKGISSLNKSISTLQASATSANTHLSKLGGQFRSLNKSSSQMARSQSHVQKSLDKTGKAVGEARNEIQAFGKDAALAIRRFSAFTVATGVVFGFVRAVQSATKAAIDYEREVVKIVQVTGASANQIKGLNATIKELSVSLGVDANELAELSRMFAQTGQSIDQVRHSINAVAKSSLAPTFGRMKDTAEGLIAAMAQFGIAAEKQEAILASLNAVSKKFAVESEDLISVIRRAGGVFAASSKGFEEPIEGLQQLIGIFTAVRSTTRESADTIAVGLRTIFTRIQRRGTIEFLKQFNIELVDAQGNFIGLFPAFQQLSKGLDSIIKRGDALTLSAITEELGGVRQVGKLIPAITQFNKALQATKIAGEAAKQGLGKDVALALQPLGKQFELLQQRFSALIRDITQSKTFQNMAKVALSLGNAFLSVAETLKPLLPMLATLATIKITKGLFEFGKGFVGGLTKGGGAGGMGGALGGAITGGGGGGSSGGAARSLSVQQALNSALKNNSTLLTNNNTALKQLGTQVVSNTTAINNVGGKVTPVIGAIGNLINALNRSSLGGGFGGGFGGGRRGPRKFARGGYVSGPSHAQGGVPAILEGGEYVIPKTQYHAGLKAGKVRKGIAADRGDKGFRGSNIALGKLNLLERKIETLPDKDVYGGAFLTPEDGMSDLTGSLNSSEVKKSLAKTGVYKILQRAKTKGPLKNAIKDIEKDVKDLSDFTIIARSLSQDTSTNIEDTILEGVLHSVQKGSGILAGKTRIDSGGNTEAVKVLRQSNIDNIIGNVYEAILTNAGSPYSPADRDAGNETWDFPQGLGSVAGAFKEGNLLASKVETDAKTRFTSGNVNSLMKKVKNTETAKLEKKLLQLFASADLGASFAKGETKLAAAKDFAKSKKVKAITVADGGSIFAPKGTDTVPAMLTPGEFVINKKSAEKFGYGNLKKINRYAKGGVAATGNVQYLADGTGVEQITHTGKTGASAESLNKAFQTLEAQVDKAIQAYNEGTLSYDKMISTVDRAEQQQKTVQNKQEELGGGFGAGTFAPTVPEQKKKLKLRTEDVVRAAKGDPSKDAAEKAAQKMNALTDVVGGSIGAIGGFTAALSSFDMSSPEAAFSSIMSLSFAVSQAQQAMTAFTTYTKLSTVANKAAAASEWKEVAANLAAAKSEFVKGLTDFSGFKDFFKGGKGGGGMMKKVGGMFGGRVGRVGGAISKKVMGGSKSLTGALTVPRKGGMTLARGLGTVGKGAGIAAAAGLLAGVVGDALDKKIRGAKEEIVPGVSGVRGGTVEGAGLAGGLKGAAKGAAMGMVFGPVGAALGGLGGFIMGKIGEELAQAEFNAFVEMQENLKGANEQLGRFAKLNEISTTAMINLNSAVAKPLQSFDKIQAASFAKAEGGFGLSQMLGTGGTVQKWAGTSGGIGGGTVSTLGGAAAGAALGAAVGSVVPVIGTLAGAIVGGLGGALTGLVTALFTTDKTIENTALSFDRAAQSITPEFIENLNKAVDQASGSLIDKLDMSQVKEIAAIETTSQNLNPSEQASLTTSAFKQMNTVLNGSTGETSRFVKELNKLTATKIEVGLIDGIRAEADLLGDEGGKELKAAFVNLRSELDIDELVKTGDMSKAKAAIQNSGLDDEHKKMVEKIILSQMEEINAKKVAAAQQKVIEDAAKRSRKALDALVAGLERFGERTQGIAVQMGLVADQMKTAFAQITGEKTIGEFKQFNPFENLASASDQQIDSSIGQLKAFGGNTPEADAAFRDTSGMLKAGRDFPLAMRNVVDKLDAAQAGGAKLTNQEVIDAVQLEFGGSLPPEMLKSLTAALEEGRATSRQGGSAFTFDTLKEMFEEGGNVSDLLGKAFNATKEEMAGFDKSVAEMKNALMDIARIQEQMAKRRMEVELSMLDKQEAIRDRVNSALGNTAGAFQRAQGDLQKRMTIQMRGGLKPGEGTAFTGNVLDPAALFGRLETLDQKREKLQGVQGQGTPEEVRKNSEELGKLNREINGTEAALRQLSNDTRMLAAIEAKIAEQQARQKDFGGTVTSIIDGLDKLERGEMSVQDFNQQITGPLSTVEKAFDPNQDLNRQEGADLMRRIQSNDPLIMGQIRRKTEDIARQRGVDTSDAGAMAEIRGEVMDNLMTNLASSFSGLADSLGLENLGDILRDNLDEMFKAENEAALLGKEMEKIGAMQVGVMQKMLEREEAALATVLDNADQGFNTAVTNFENAVQEFALMRGGLDAADMASVDKDVAKATAERDAAQKAFTESQNAHDTKVKEAREKAEQEAAKKADEGNISDKLKQERVKAAGDAAAAQAERDSKIDQQEKKKALDKAEANLESKTEFKNKMVARKDLQDSEAAREKEKKTSPPQTAPTQPALVPTEDLTTEELHKRAEDLGIKTTTTRFAGGGYGAGATKIEEAKSREQIEAEIKQKEKEQQAEAATTAADIAVAEQDKQAATIPELSSIVQLLGEIKNCVCMGTAGRMWEAGKSAYGAAVGVVSKADPSSYAKTKPVWQKGTKKKRIKGKVVTDEDVPTASDVKTDEENKEGTAAGGCCSDVIVRMDKIIGLLGTGGPKSEAKDVAEKTAKAAEKEYKIGGETYVKGEGGRLQLKKKDEEAGTSTGLIDSLKKLTTGEMSVPDFNKLIPDLAQSIQASGTDDPGGFIANMFDNLSTTMKGVSDSLGLSEVAKMFDVAGGDNLKGVASNDVVKIDPATGRPVGATGIDKDKYKADRKASADAAKDNKTLEKVMNRDKKKKEGKEIAQLKSDAMLRPGDTAGRLAGFRNAAINSNNLSIRNAGLSMNTGALSQEVKRQQTQQQVANNIQAQKDSTDPRNAPVNPPTPSDVAGDKNAASGNVFDELRKTMEGKELAEKMSLVFETGGDYVAEKIMGAFKGAIPPKIEMTGQLGAITVQLVGGKVLEDWSKGVISTIRGEIKTAIEKAVKPEARNDLSGDSGTISASEPANSDFSGS